MKRSDVREDTYFLAVQQELRKLRWRERWTAKYVFVWLHLRFESWRCVREQRRRYRLWRETV
jgi:hypothetical protein